MLLIDRLKESVSFIKMLVKTKPEIGIILGSGLGNFARELKITCEISYDDIPNFPVSTVRGHEGKLIFGELEGKNVVVMAGRFHVYEGYTPEQVTFPVRMMKLLGVEALFLSNAAGGVNPSFKVGDIMIISDHISFFTPNPLIGPNVEELGVRFPDMSEPYDRGLINKAEEIGQKAGFNLKQGVYVGVTGPTFETHAEYKLIAALGGDAVGMSTVLENIVAVHAGMKVFAVSVITDLGIHIEDTKITHDEVLAAANEAEPKMAHLFKGLIAAM